MSLPTELKLKILESLSSWSERCKDGLLCKEMRYLASDNDLWKQKCFEEAKDFVVNHQSCNDGSVDWKKEIVYEYECGI
ncbi:hypothetical protein AALP_AA5G086400 [Arabis alpina]|uniref:F-box domain-containing protein n=1 Tax=Arabis alpina TaxID=50452 RepID=A0A087GVS9_ARAAL|nr:hypothetical protein AALP_AA5G086400 [Arabis alpina]